MGRLVYIACPYTFGGKLRNVHRAMKCAETLIKLGYIPYIPILNHYWDERHYHSPDFWYEYDNELLSKTKFDFIYRLKGRSVGADKEMKLARKLKIKELKI
jgi:hypothetical protein